jgi:hypothetical protein
MTRRGTLRSPLRAWLLAGCLALCFCLPSLVSGTAALAFSTHLYLSELSGGMAPVGPENFAVNRSTGNPTSGDIYMPVNEYIDVFNASGSYLSQLSDTEGAPFRLGRIESVRIAVNDTTDQVYVTVSDPEFEPAQVYMFSPEGVEQAQFGHSLLTGTTRFEETPSLSLAVNDASGDVYVTDTRNSSCPETGACTGKENFVDVFSSTGALLSTWTGASTPNHSFLSIKQIAIDSVSGDAYIESFENGGWVVNKFDPAGNYLSHLVQETDGNNEDGLAIDSSGDVYVVDVGGGEGGTIVDEFGPSGSLLAQLSGTPRGHFAGLGGVAVGPSGEIYVGEDTVEVFAPSIVVAPDVSSGAVSNITATSATLTGTSDPDDTSTTYQFQYGTSSSYGQLSPATPGVVGSDATTHDLTANLTELTPRTTYHYRLTATNSVGTNYSEDRTFRTPELAPTVANQPPQAAGIGRTTATLPATVNPEGSPTTYYILYGPTSDYGFVSPSISAGSSSGDENVSLSLNGLKPDTTYHYAVGVTDEGGTVISSDQTFTTGSPTPPLVSTGAASGVDQSDATLAASVDPQGEETTYEFQLGTSTSYGLEQSGSALAAKGGAQAVSVVFTGLERATTYHYRIEATNADGTSYGVDQTFTTPGSPLTTLAAPPFIAAPAVVFPTEAGTGPTQKALTNAQKLSAALKACRKESKKKQAKCEAQARKKYVPAKKRKR